MCELRTFSEHGNSAIAEEPCERLHRRQSHAPILQMNVSGTPGREMIVRFPKKLAVLNRLGLVRATKQVALDTEIRQVDQAIAALKERRRILIYEYKKEVSLIAKATSGCMLASCFVTLYGDPLHSFRNVLMIVSTILR